jgi:hypothetical protein
LFILPIVYVCVKPIGGTNNGGGMRKLVASMVVMCAVGAWGVRAEIGIQEKGAPAARAQIESAQGQTGIQETIGADSITRSKVIIENSSSTKELKGLEHDDFAVASILREPVKPIGKTIAGSVCTVFGGLFTVSSGMLLALMASTDAPSEVCIVPATGLAAGIGFLVPGISLLVGSQNDWNAYKTWKKKYKSISENPVMGLRYTFDF